MIVFYFFYNKLSQFANANNVLFSKEQHSLSIYIQFWFFGTFTEQISSCDHIYKQ